MGGSQYVENKLIAATPTSRRAWYQQTPLLLSLPPIYIRLSLSLFFISTFAYHFLTRLSDVITNPSLFFVSPLSYVSLLCSLRLMSRVVFSFQSFSNFTFCSSLFIFLYFFLFISIYPYKVARPSISSLSISFILFAITASVRFRLFRVFYIV